jgi:hypothetical protein
MLVPLTLTMSGCLGDKSVPIIMSTLDSNGNVVQTITNATSTASVEKERMFWLGTMHRDTMRAKMYETEGFKMDWVGKESTRTITILQGNNEPITITTTETDYLPVTSFKQSPQFQQQLPNGPSVHPVWGTTTRVLEKLVMWGFGAWGVDRIFGHFSDVASLAGTTYQGPVINSNNTAGGYQQDFTLDMGGAGGPSLPPEEIPIEGTPVELPDGTSVVLPPSCSSVESLLAGAPGCEGVL